MLKIVAIAIFLLSSYVQAQTVISVTGATATVNFETETKIVPNEQVQFFDADLNLVGTGIVTKVSPTKKKVLVQVKPGQIKNGMTLESNNPEVVESRPKKSEAPRRAEYSAMNEEDRRVLARGEIGTPEYVIGGVVGTIPALGFGIGHAIQGRYSDKGWIFTVGELGSIAVLAAGFGDCVTSDWSSRSSCNGGLITLGAFGFLGFRIWEIVDVWAGPLEHNRRYRMLKNGYNSSITFQPALLPLADGGGMLGMKLTF